MTDDEKWQHVKESLEILKREKDKLEKLVSVVQILPESPVVEPFYIINDVLAETLSKLVGDEQGYIEWFIFEADFGEGDMKAGLVDDLRLIKTVDDLRWLVELRVPTHFKKVEVKSAKNP